MTATTSLLRFWSLLSLPKALINKSMPLFLNSYLPLLMIKKASSEVFVPERVSSTLNIFSLEAFLFSDAVFSSRIYDSLMPFIVMTSGSRCKNCLHSSAVTSLTVVNTSAFCAALYSIDCCEVMLNLFAIAAGSNVAKSL